MSFMVKIVLKAEKVQVLYLIDINLSQTKNTHGQEYSRKQVKNPVNLAKLEMSPVFSLWKR